MTLRLCGMLLLLVAALGCSTPAFVPTGSPFKPLTTFNRIDPAMLKSEIPKKDPPPAEAPPSPSAFLRNFRGDLILRLHRKKVFNLPTGPLLIIEATLLRYDYDDRNPSGAHDTKLFAGFVDLDVVFKDEKGTRIGGGKASVTGNGSSPEAAMTSAERLAVSAIADYLRRQVKKGSDKGEPDEP